MSNKTCGILALTGLLGLSAFLLNCGTSNSRPSGVLFVASQGASNVGSYAINLSKGSLSLINANATTDTPPTSVVLDKSGKVVFVLNTGSITAYTINSNGTLSTPTSTSLPDPNPVAFTTDPAGKFLFVASQGAASLDPHLSVFSIQSGSTALTPVGSPIALTRVPTSVATITDPKGNTLLYVTNNKDLVGSLDNTLSQYTVDSTGALTLHEANGPYLTAFVPSAVLAVSTTPTGVAGGVFIYVTNATPNNTANIFQLCTAITATCPQQSDIDNFFLNPVTPAVAIGGTNPVALTADPTNNFLYIVDHDSSDVRGFRINPTTGALSALSPPDMSTGLGPVALTMHSSGKFLFVSNNGASSISGFNVDTTTGALSLPTTVTSSAQPYGLAAK